MKTFILATMLALTAASGAVIISNQAQAAADSDNNGPPAKRSPRPSGEPVAHIADRDIGFHSPLIPPGRGREEVSTCEKREPGFSNSDGVERRGRSSKAQ